MLSLCGPHGLHVNHTALGYSVVVYIDRIYKNGYDCVSCKEKLGKPLPPQYALELLTVYAWERGSGVTEFNTAQGFRTVLELVTKYRQLRIYWTKYYDFQDKEISNYMHRQLRGTRPVILDPADPTGNVAGSNSEGWWQLAEEAAAWLQYPCFKNWDGSLVRSWDVPVNENGAFISCEHSSICPEGSGVRRCAGLDQRGQDAPQGPREGVSNLG
ncbi:2'-5'-oligoadenylate synthase 1A [Microtus ochrogaster]|uniref:2'-5'-oligoadenylate synthase 1A n=1 Tax=Microtus ochrogaster TaxID=79684 RepID=A0A8J6GWB5_MICOH|nr:2'-5'-oligoadenylate synthase 1A [Microtus ochrogaster]